MTNEQLKEAIAIEAVRRWKERGVHFIETLANIAVELTQEGWTPPEPVDPDLAEAEAIWFEGKSPVDLVLTGIKRGRALATAEAKPGLVWVKHDGAEESPTKAKHVLGRYNNGDFSADYTVHFYWPEVTHYAVITPPEDVA